MAYSSEYKSNDFLHVNSCDCQQLEGIDIGSLREKGRRDYHILFITEGCCFIRENDSETPIKEGSVIFYQPYERQEYYFKADIKSTSYYVHFSGTECDNILKEFGITPRYFYVGKVPRAEKLFKKMIEETFLKRPYYEKISSSYLYSILGLLGRKRISHSEPEFKSSNRIEDICRKMIQNYNEDVNINLLAQKLNISTSRFLHLFKECTGTSPKNYIIGIRIKKACELLENTDLSILSISEQVGICDQNYFSRLFKRHMGISPTEYRKKFV